MHFSWLELTFALKQLTQEEYDRSLIVFISHCWLRGWSGAEGWDGRPHPDNAAGDKFTLCVRGIEKVKRGMAPDMEQVYIWLDYGCIDQDGNPAGELKLLDKMVSDCIFTPIHDPEHASWDYRNKLRNAYKDYDCTAWKGTPFSYLTRGWCRIEMSYAANIALLEDSAERRNKMRAALKMQRDEGRRPHILYGSKEDSSATGPPLVLPPLQNKMFEEYHPEKGHLTKDSDREHIHQLVETLKPYMKFVDEGYEGELNENDEYHGKAS